MVTAPPSSSSTPAMPARRALACRARRTGCTGADSPPASGQDRTTRSRLSAASCDPPRPSLLRRLPLAALLA